MANYALLAEYSAARGTMIMHVDKSPVLSDAKISCSILPVTEVHAAWQYTLRSILLPTDYQRLGLG